MQREPCADWPSVRAGDQSALMHALLALANHWFGAAGSHLSFPVPAAEVARRGDSSAAGLLAAAVDLRALLGATPQGREALRDLGFERLLEDFEREGGATGEHFAHGAAPQGLVSGGVEEVAASPGQA